ncbi:MAG TPA: hypothetical protein VHF02_09930 [Luteimonas sp.]|nr:hypothetical protein [Luteimonas sp.]
MQGAAGDLFAPVDDGATPLDPDECAGLIPDWITTRSDLNVAEQANIEKGLRWARRMRVRGDVLVDRGRGPGGRQPITRLAFTS